VPLKVRAACLKGPANECCCRYAGSSPWTKGELKTYSHPRAFNGNQANILHDSRTLGDFTEKWAAYLNPGTGKAVGIYSPSASFFTAYRCGPEGDPNSDCSYVAPVENFSVQDTSKTQYDAWLIYGTIEEIRGTVYKLAGK
jgi:hypothetical protein